MLSWGCRGETRTKTSWSPRSCPQGRPWTETSTPREKKKKASSTPPHAPNPPHKSDELRLITSTCAHMHRIRILAALARSPARKKGVAQAGNLSSFCVCVCDYLSVWALAACARCRVFISRPPISFSCLTTMFGQRKGNGGRNCGGCSILYSTLLGSAWLGHVHGGLGCTPSLPACVSAHSPPKEKSQVVPVL